MAFAILIYPIYLARILTLYALVLAPAIADGPQKVQRQSVEPALVRVNITTKTRGAKDMVEINGKLLPAPIIIQALSTTGIVLDHWGHVMTFLGYRWIDIQNQDPRIEVFDGAGQKWKGRLVGIDQSNGVAVIQLLGGRPKKTPVCIQCDVRDGTTVMAPVLEGQAQSRYRETRILSVGADWGIPEQGGWAVALSPPSLDIGQPILTKDHRVLGFVASQDPRGIRTVVYRISQLLASAEKILKRGGNIPAGWLGVFLGDSRATQDPGITIQSVEPDSPAQRAGLVAGDLLLRYNGQEIWDVRQFIRLVQVTPIGSKANLEIVRQGTPMTMDALVEKWRPQQDQGRLSFSLPGALVPSIGMAPEPRSPSLLFGLDTIVLTPSLADALQLHGQTGLLVIDVAKQMPADRAGVLVGDVIEAIDGQPVIDAPSFASYLQTHTWGAQPVFKILRKGVERMIPVQIPDRDK
jgi:hypothetical protein